MAKKKPAASRSGKGPVNQQDENDLDFEGALAEVEQIVAQLETGELGLSESLQQYETGIKQLKQCHSLLDAAEQRVSLLSGFDAEGNPVTGPMQELDSGVGGKKPRRKRGSASTSKGKEGVDDALKSAESGDDSVAGLDSVDDSPGLF